MDWTTIASIATIVVCSLGVGYTVGKYRGISGCLEYLREEGFIEYDD